MLPRRPWLSALVVALVLSAASPAWADEPAPAEKSWYGWQTLVADGTSLLVVPLAATAPGAAGLGVVAVGGYLLAPPIIHGAHGRWGISAASLGLRVALPAIGALLGGAIDHDCNNNACVPLGTTIGIAAGAFGAVAIDASLLSF